MMEEANFPVPSRQREELDKMAGTGGKDDITLVAMRVAT